MTSKSSAYGREENIFNTIAYMNELIQEGLPVLGDPIRIGISNLAIDLYLKEVVNPQGRRDS